MRVQPQTNVCGLVEWLLCSKDKESAVLSPAVLGKSSANENDCDRLFSVKDDERSEVSSTKLMMMSKEGHQCVPDPQ